MHVQNDYVISTNSRTQKQITLIGVIIGLSWVAVSLWFNLSGRDSQVNDLALGPYDNSKSILLVQLITYSFIHELYSHLIFQLIVLAFLVWIARESLSPADFIRLYSLGSICGGLVFLLACSLFEQQTRVIGSGMALMAMLGALAILKPKREVTLLLFFVLPIRTRLIWIAVFFIGASLLQLQTEPSLALSMVSGSIVGIMYAFVERFRYRYGMKRKTALPTKF